MAAIIALSLLWFIFDPDGRGLFSQQLLPVSWIEMAGYDCSGWGCTDDWRAATKEAQAVVMAAAFGVLICFTYIFSPSLMRKIVHTLTRGSEGPQ